MTINDVIETKSDNILPVVSVIIPFFNRIELVVRAVNSALQQDYPNTYIIIVNDGSTCDDAKLLNRISSINNIQYVKLPHNMGPSFARNEGIARSVGKYIAFLDSDDEWLPNKLTLQIRAMVENGWRFSHTSYFSCYHDVIKLVPSGRWNYTFPLVAFTCKIATPTVIVERSMLAGRQFPPEFRYGEDVLLWIELAKISKLYGVDIPLSKVFVGDATAAFNNSIQVYVLKALGGRGWKVNAFYNSCTNVTVFCEMRLDELSLNTVLVHNIY